MEDKYAAAFAERDRWLARPDLDPEMRALLLELTDPEDILDAFYRELSFGTGGLRGVLGAGLNRMNLYVVRKATQGLADHWKSRFASPSAAIAHDSRNKSAFFAREAAGVLAANGIKVYLYKELMPTPALSFAVRYHRCSGGIMVTASHNPAKYNGYKVYDRYGGQMTEEAEEVMACIEKLDLFEDARYMPFEDALAAGLAEWIDGEAEEAYLQAVLAERAGVDCRDLHVVYSPLNGTGNKPVREILKRTGVRKLDVVKEQELPDGNFPTCPYPNPEKREALEKGLALCRAGGTADLLLATDPDCDRVGTAVRHKGDYLLLSGNEAGVLLLDFLCRTKMLPERPVAVTTIVSTKLANRIAERYGVELRRVLTGFKYIGEQIDRLEDAGEEKRYVFGFEESYGYLAGPYVRDKDAVNASMLLCEMAAWYKLRGKTLKDRMEELYREYGYYADRLCDYSFEGAEGMEKMASIMRRLREEPPAAIAGQRVTERTDYGESRRWLSGAGCDRAAGYVPVSLPKSEV
ncbi:MAG: phospho-sugar mutase, partial [Bacillota bacterium]|nr:phospho-sugar mutase [Bacillota bacterium]